MAWEVSFSKFPVVSTFRDARALDLELDGDLMASIKELVNNGHGKTIAGGIEIVQAGEDHYPGESFYVLSAKKNSQIYSLLFKLNGNESKLVGVYPETITREELEDLLYNVLSEKVEQVSVVI